MNQKEKLKAALQEYCRGKQAIRDAEFTLSKSHDQHQASGDELVRVMKATGCKDIVYRGNTYYTNSENNILIKQFDSVVIED